MPELPEVETVRRSLLPVVNKPIEAVEFHRQSYSRWNPNFQEQLLGQSFLDLEAG